MKNQDFLEKLMKATGPTATRLGVPLAVYFRMPHPEKPQKLMNVPYTTFIGDEYHSGGKTFSIDKHPKHIPHRKEAKQVDLTPYHLEDSIEAHQLAALSAVLLGLKSGKSWSNNGHPAYFESICSSNGEVLERKYLQYALIIATRFHDIGKVVSRTLKVRYEDDKRIPYFAYNGHNVSGFNLIRSAITRRWLARMFPDFSDDIIIKMRIAILLFIYLHQKREVAASIIWNFYNIIEFASSGNVREFVELLNLLLISDRKGSITFVEGEEYLYEAPDGVPVNILLDTSKFLYLDDKRAVFDEIISSQEKGLFVAVLPIGAPGAGKSTFFSELKEYAAQKGTVAVKVSYDDIRVEMYLDGHREDENLAPAELYRRAHIYAAKNLEELNKRYIEKIKHARESADIIFLDQVNAGKKARNRTLTGIPRSTVVELFFDAPLQAHAKNNERRKEVDKYVPLPTVVGMYLNTLPPRIIKNLRGKTIWFETNRVHDR